VVVVTRTGYVLDDRYQLNEPIAAGGVGQVWRAADLLLDRPVAVKLLRPEYAEHPETLERFRAEAKHAGSLTHPCIARVYDYGNAGPTASPYLVMEYVNGPSLADMLAVDPVNPVLALDVVAQAAAGLDAAHRSGLVHRDIKPGNILLGEDGLVKITDFGIASAAGSAPITGPGVVMGTTQYMAPERIAGGQATPASDLYSLGIIIYECLTGLPPYDGGTAGVMAGHLYLPLPPLPDGVPPELDELIARLTAKNPAARLGNAAELAAVARRVRDMLAADPSYAAGAGLAVGTGHAAVSPAVLPDDRPVRPGGPSQPQSGRAFLAGRRRAAAFAAGATVLAGAGVGWLLAAGTPHDTPAAEHGTTSLPAAAVPGSHLPAAAPPSTAHSGSPVGSPGTGAPRTGHAGATAHSPQAGTTGGQSTTATTSPGRSPTPGSSTQGGSTSPAPPAASSSPPCQISLLSICVG
jgi:hypothetical protein